MRIGMKMKEEKSVQKSSSTRLVRMIVISLLAALSLVLFFISFPLPLLPPYLKVDFSDVPALIAGLIFSPLAGIIVVLLKNAIYFIRSEEHTSELQSRGHLVCRLLLE